MGNLAIYLPRELGRPVEDRTNLSGHYDFQIAWTPDSGPCAGAATDDGSPAAVSPLSGPSLFTALQEQLGLKLESSNAAIELLVIDHAERPTEN